MNTITLSTNAKKGQRSQLVAIPAGAKFLVCLAGGVSALGDPLRDPNSYVGFHKSATMPASYHAPAINLLSYGALGVPIPDGATIASWFNGLAGSQTMTFIFRTPLNP